jgi:hypothetical protein
MDGLFFQRKTGAAVNFKGDARSIRQLFRLPEMTASPYR